MAWSCSTALTQIPGSNMLSAVVTITAGGDASMGTYDIEADLRGHYIVCAHTIPSGVTAPTANYDLEIRDANGVDLMGGALANRSDTAKETATPSAGVAIPVTGTLTLFGENNSGNSAIVTLEIVLDKP